MFAELAEDGEGGRRQKRRCRPNTEPPRRHYSDRGRSNSPGANPAFVVAGKQKQRRVDETFACVVSRVLSHLWPEPAAWGAPVCNQPTLMSPQSCAVRCKFRVIFSNGAGSWEANASDYDCVIIRLRSMFHSFLMNGEEIITGFIEQLLNLHRTYTEADLEDTLLPFLQTTTCRTFEDSAPLFTDVLPQVPKPFKAPENESLWIF